MQLFYQPELHENSDQCVFDKIESKHITKVLRNKEGDVLTITNGKGWIFQAEIISSDYKQCIAKIQSATYHAEAIYKLHIAIAPTKMNDRFEWFLEKATEIGITSITPIVCDHSERKVIKPERFEKVIQSAMKQSLQYHLPELNPLVTFNEFVSNCSGLKYIAHCEETQKLEFFKILKPKNDITILIGPEGDFSVKEIETALHHGFIPVSLGNNRLRTETAAIVACHTVAIVNSYK